MTARADLARVPLDPSDGAQPELSALIDALPALVAHWNTELRNTMANAAYVEFFGIAPAQMRGRHIREILGEQKFATNEPHLLAALNGQPQHFDQIIVDPSGAHRHAQTSYIPDHVDGVIRGCFVLVTDVTQRRNAELALADQTLRMRAILDAVTDAVISVDTDLCVADLNAAATALLGRPPVDVVGRPIGEVIDVWEDDTSLPVADLCRDVLTMDGSVHRTGLDTLRHSDAVTTPIDWTASPLIASDGTRSGVLVTVRDASDARRLLMDSRHRATHDHLTGVKNRTFLDQLGGPEPGFERRRRPPLPTAVVFLDLDGFKAINDSAGHIAGDEVLRQVSQAITASVRGSDDVVRMGGDEFAVLLRSCTLSDAHLIAQKIVDQVGAALYRWRGATFRLGVSAGIALAGTDDLTELDRAIERADLACYEAKRAGGQRVVQAGPRV